MLSSPDGFPHFGNNNRVLIVSNELEGHRHEMHGHRTTLPEHEEGKNTKSQTGM